MKKVIRLTESDLVRIVKRVINEQTTPPSEAKLSLFCQALKINSSFREYQLSFDREVDEKNSIKTLMLTRGTSSSLDKPFGNAGVSGSFELNVVPYNTIAGKYVNSDKVLLGVNPNSVVLTTFDSQQQPYLCKIDRGTDKEWVNYLNSF